MSDVASGRGANILMTSTHHTSHPDPHSRREGAATPAVSAALETARSVDPAGRPGWVITPTPLSVWVTGGLLPCLRPGHRVGFGEPPCVWRWPATLWETIVTAYSRPGDRIRVSDAGDGTVIRLALTGDRQITAPVLNHRQRAGLRLTLLDDFPRRVRTRASLLADRWSTPTPGEAADLLIVTPPCPDTDQPQTDPVQTDPVQTEPGLDGSSSVTTTDAVLAYQLQALTRGAALVRPGGVVAVLTRITPDRDGAVDRIGPLVTHARSLGLRYLQHNPLIHATVTDGRLYPRFGPDDPGWHLPYPDDGPAPWTWAPSEPSSSGYGGPPAFVSPALHLPVHSDLIVFIQATDTASDDQPGGAQ